MNYHGRKWSSVKLNIPRTLTYVKVESVIGHVDAKGQLVTFVNGIRAPYDAGTTRDWKAGAIVWPVVKGKCHETKSSLYLGPANFMKTETEARVPF